MFGKNEAPKQAIVFAAATVVTGFEGVQIDLRESEPWAADDPFVQLRPDLFEDHPSRPRRTLA